MKIRAIKIHNFRSIIDESVNLNDYSLLIGSNNCGKSNVIDALRVFYEKDGYKFDLERDFPKSACNPTGDDSWIEITYRCTDDEFINLKDEYKQPDNCFTVRKVIFTTSTDKKAKNALGLYGYENGELGTNSFYGWKSVGSGKLGEIIFIPAVSDLANNMKMSGPSPFRDLITGIAKKVVSNSTAYSELNTAFDTFNSEIKKEKSEGESLDNLEKDLTKEIEDWEVRFKIDFNKISSDELIKNLISHKLIDGRLNEEMNSSSFGQGLQRQLIFGLIKLLAQYSQPPISDTTKKEFSPELTLLLYEEPEAFLHPPQKLILHSKLKEFAVVNKQQVLISTHSPYFVNRNILNLDSLIKVNKHNCVTELRQIVDSMALFSENETLNEIVKGTRYANNDKLDTEIAETIKYFLWLNAERLTCFFAKNVLLVEGPSEKCLIDYLLENSLIKLDIDQVYVLDCMGKFNIHRFMGMFGVLGIKHYVLFDKDTGHTLEAVHNNINNFILDHANDYTKKIDSIDPDLEGFLGTTKPSNEHKKPLSILYQFITDPEKYEAKTKDLETKLNTLFS